MRKPRAPRQPRLAPRRGLLAVTLGIAIAVAPGTLAEAAGPHAGRRAPRLRPARVTLEWVGDIAFSTDRGLPRGGPPGALGAVGGELRGADLTLGNLEGTLSTGGTSKCGGSGSATCFAFRAPPAYARGLRAVGFGLLNQANNHAFDYGPEGQRQTLAALRGAGIAHTGRPGEITVRSLRGVRVAFLGFAPYSWAASLTDIGAARRLVGRAARRAPIVVAIIHAGAEGADRAHTPHGTEYFLGENRGDPRRFAHAAIDAGAALVLGSGPHVIRGIERYRHHLIAYSLGNFAGPHTLSTSGALAESAILRVTLDRRGRVLRGRWIALRLSGSGLPRRDPAGASIGLVQRLSREDFGAGRYRIAPSGAIRP